jgi:excinuclease ABC subunit C
VDSPGPPAASPRATVARLPLGPGVYRFRDAAGRVLYVGRAVCLRRRVASYWGDLGDRRHLAPMVARIAQVEAVPCASAHEAAWLERNLLERRTPDPSPAWTDFAHQTAELAALLRRCPG